MKKFTKIFKFIYECIATVVAIMGLIIFMPVILILCLIHRMNVIEYLRFLILSWKENGGGDEEDELY